MLITPAQRYDTLSRSLHWLMAAIVVASWALIRIKGWFPKGSTKRASVSSLHEQLGAAVLLLLALRMTWRWSHPVKPHRDSRAGVNAGACIAGQDCALRTDARIAFTRHCGGSGAWRISDLPWLHPARSVQKLRKPAAHGQGTPRMDGRRDHGGCRPACHGSAVASLHVARRHAAENAGPAPGRNDPAGFPPASP
jgi:hypothetical protein